jgi:low temperature requirement protein LtrA
VPEVFTSRSAAFALGNAVLRLIWMVPWFTNRTQAGIPWWRPVMYSAAPAALWLVSIAVPGPAKYVLWIVAIAIELVLLTALGSQRSWLRDALDVDHLVERVSLFVVIVFGESIVSIIGSLVEHWDLGALICAGLAFLVVSALAWIFFAYATTAVGAGLHRLQQRGDVYALRDAFMYLPYFFVVGITLVAAALSTAVADADAALPIGALVSLCAGTCLFFAASAAESLRYGSRLRYILPWAPAGVVLPWALLALAGAPALAVVGGAVVVIAAMIVIEVLNVRRMRRETPPAQHA